MLVGSFFPFLMILSHKNYSSSHRGHITGHILNWQIMHKLSISRGIRTKHMPPKTVVQLINTLQSVFDLIETLHAMTAFDTSDSEMDECFFTFDILIYFFIFVSMITTWIWLVRLERLSFSKFMQQLTVSPLPCLVRIPEFHIDKYKYNRFYFKPGIYKQ